MRPNSKTSPSQEWQSLQYVKMGSPFLKGSLDLQMFSFALTLKERVEDTLDQFMQELDNQVNLMLGVDLSPINLEAENQETSGEVLCTEGQ